MHLAIPRISRDPLAVSVEQGQQLYVIGANGTGKSALFQYWVSSINISPIRRIAAHRQTWLPSGDLDFTAKSHREFEQNRQHWDREENSRWMEYSPAQRQSAILFDLVSKDNSRNRIISQHIDNKEQQKAAAFAADIMSPFRQLNDLLALGTFKISLKNSNDEELLAQHKDSDQIYSIAQMSDGERAAAIMAANVLVADPGTVFLIDEPERHLHRSIIEPFLSALFSQRQDCMFVISTHEIALPIANPMAQIVMLSSCSWNGNTPKEWDADLLEPSEHLPEDLKRDILGSRQRILFIEGTVNSLDLPLYGALFPELSVIPKGSCEDVIRAVKGLRSSCKHHHVKAFGLIDRDDRTKHEVCELAQSNIFALDVYSIESLYYCSDSIDAVARRQADSLNCKFDEMKLKATQNALTMITNDDSLSENMAARRSERLVHRRFRVCLPNRKTIKTTDRQLTFNESIENPFLDELKLFNSLTETGDLDGLIARYPLRESGVFGQITKDLECGKKENYERMVIARVYSDEGFARKLKKRINPLAKILDGQTNHDF